MQNQLFVQHNVQIASALNDSIIKLIPAQTGDGIVYMWQYFLLLMSVNKPANPTLLHTVFGKM